MVTVNEAGEHDVLVRAQRLIGSMPARELAVIADPDDDAVALEHRAVGNHFRAIAARRLADHVLAADEGRGHGGEADGREEPTVPRGPSVAQPLPARLR